VPYQNAYASSKAWIKSFTLALADEYRGRGVGIYLLSPGMMITEMVTDVEVVEGYEERLRALPTVLRILASRPDVPAARALWIAAEAKADVDHPDVRVMGPGKMLAGVLGEGVRRLLRRPAPELAVAVRTVPPDIDSRSGGGA
jgi:NAD(P)-dependent dehydrogenase (short-subunit alcohol dehydrogenase family)